MSNPNPVFPFKRLSIGDTFATKDGKTFRKVAKASAFALLPSGRGQTHAKIAFTRSTVCTLIQPVAAS